MFDVLTNGILKRALQKHRNLSLILPQEGDRSEGFGNSVRSIRREMQLSYQQR
jgi:hypothetical protein